MDIDAAIFNLVEGGTVLPSYFDGCFKPVTTLPAWGHERATATSISPQGGCSFSALDSARAVTQQGYRSESVDALKSTHSHHGKQEPQDANLVHERSFQDLTDLNRMGMDFMQPYTEAPAACREDMTLVRSNSLSSLDKLTHAPVKREPAHTQEHSEQARVVVSPYTESNGSERTVSRSPVSEQETSEGAPKSKKVGAKPQQSRRNKTPVFWSPEEHEKFLDGLQKFGLRGSLGKGGADLLAMFLGTRSASQI
eukprot:916272-Rhodomonas_salina.1